MDFYIHDFAFCIFAFCPPSQPPPPPTLGSICKCGISLRYQALSHYARLPVTWIGNNHVNYATMLSSLPPREVNDGGTNVPYLWLGGFSAAYGDEV